MDSKKSDRLGEKTGRKNWITAIRDRKETEEEIPTSFMRIEKAIEERITKWTEGMIKKICG